MKPVIKVVILINDVILISQIEAITSELGEPDCRLVKPYLVKNFDSYNGDINALEPYLMGLTSQNFCEFTSDKILTLVEPTKKLLEKYQDLIKE